MTSFPERKVQLLARRAELAVRLHEIDEESSAHQSQDWEDLATEREGDEVLEGMGVSGKAEIAMIDAALARIERDAYGDCATCGEEISAARLDLLPYSPLCRHCAA